MQIHTLNTSKPLKKKRVGRGGKRGTTSGRGTKGQKARAGHKIRPAERDLIQRLPKLKGLKNKSIRERAFGLNVGTLSDRVNGDIINRETLLQAGLIKKTQRRIKILGKGDIKKALTFKGLPVSTSAKEKIEAAGGKIIDSTQKSESNDK